MSAVPQPALTRICTKCSRELPLTEEYYRRAPKWLPGSDDADYWRRKCRRCANVEVRAQGSEARAALRAVKAAEGPARFKPRVLGDGAGGPVGGYTEHPEEGYRFVCLPDSHGYLIDWQAAEAALAFVRYYRPVRIFLLGDHVDFASISRFDKSPSDIARMGEDLEACSKFLRLVRESAPDARISYRKGNHEARFARFLWKHQEIAALLNAKGMDLPNLLGLGELNIEWVDSGTEEATPALIVKHGHVVRARSGYTASGELDRNGISGISGHTHRLGQVYKRSRAGMLTWVESGCLCQYDPDYMEGQTSDWQQGLSFGTIALRGGGFSVHTAPIIKGRVKAGSVDIGA